MFQYYSSNTGIFTGCTAARMKYYGAVHMLWCVWYSRGSCSCDEYLPRACCCTNGWWTCATCTRTRCTAQHVLLCTGTAVPRKYAAVDTLIYEYWYDDKVRVYVWYQVQKAVYACLWPCSNVYKLVRIYRAVVWYVSAVCKNAPQEPRQHQTDGSPVSLLPQHRSFFMFSCEFHVCCVPFPLCT